jgi:hypothetical protein
MTLGIAREGSAVASAKGAMTYEWGESCDAWTVDQHYKLTIGRTDSKTIDVEDKLATWESKDGLRYRFDHQATSNGAAAPEIKGSAQLDGPDKDGTASFEAPSLQTIKLQSGALFPSAHALMLIQSAQAGSHFLLRRVFDGTQAASAPQVTATIGPKIDPDPEVVKGNPLLKQPGWHVWLVFLPPDEKIEKPSYELDMLMLENGISREITVDYGSYTIAAKLDHIEALPKPKC